MSFLFNIIKPLFLVNTKILSYKLENSVIRIGMATIEE